GSLVAVSSTIARNHAQTPSTIGYGGGVYVGSSATAVLRHVTLSANSVHSLSAANHGGNLFVAGRAHLSDSIVVDGTTRAQASNCYTLAPGTLSVTGRNIYRYVGGSDCRFPDAALAATSTELTPLG